MVSLPCSVLSLPHPNCTANTGARRRAARESREVAAEPTQEDRVVREYAFGCGRQLALFLLG